MPQKLTHPQRLRFCFLIRKIHKTLKLKKQDLCRLWPKVDRIRCVLKSRVYIEMDMVKVFENKLFFRRISRILLPELFSAELNKNVHVFQRIIKINIQNIFKYRKRKKTIYSQTHGICWGLNYVYIFSFIQKFQKWINELFCTYKLFISHSQMFIGLNILDEFWH